MTTFFQPQNYSSVEEMKAASFFDAVSDTTINGIDVFGYVDGVAYSASYEESYDDEDETYTTWVSSGDTI